MNTSTPVVSIILPTFNRAHFIGETIQSVIDQTFTEWELLVLDDGSDDNTKALVQQFSDERIHYISLPHTGYIGKTRNIGIQKSTGTHIAFLDSDDLWGKNKLEIQLSLLQKFPQAYFVFSNGEQFGEGAVHPPDSDSLFVGNVFLQQLVYNRFTFYAPSLLFKKSVVDTVGLMDEVIPTARDIYYFYYISHRFEGIFTNERLVKIRKHTTNTSTKSGDAPYLINLKMLKEFEQKKMISPFHYKLLTSQCYYKMALRQFQRGHSREAASNFSNYIKLKPLDWKGWVRLLQASLSSLR